MGPNPVDTYRPPDLEKLGVRNATDLLTNLPQEAGGTFNQNILDTSMFGAGDFSDERDCFAHRKCAIGILPIEPWLGAYAAFSSRRRRLITS